MSVLFSFPLEQQASSDSHNTSGVIIGIVFGVIGAVLIILLASFCTARKWQWPSSYKTRKTNSNQHDRESSPNEMTTLCSDLNGLCGDTNNVQYSQVVKRPPEKGECVFFNPLSPKSAKHQNSRKIPNFRFVKCIGCSSVLSLVQF